MGILFNASMEAQKRNKNNKQTQVAMSLTTGKRERTVLTHTGFLFLFFIFLLLKGGGGSGIPVPKDSTPGTRLYPQTILNSKFAEEILELRCVNPIARENSQNCNCKSCFLFSPLLFIFFLAFLSLCPPNSLSFVPTYMFFLPLALSHLCPSSHLSPSSVI